MCEHLQIRLLNASVPSWILPSNASFPSQIPPIHASVPCFISLIVLTCCFSHTSRMWSWRSGGSCSRKFINLSSPAGQVVLTLASHISGQGSIPGGTPIGISGLLLAGSHATAICMAIPNKQLVHRAEPLAKPELIPVKAKAHFWTSPTYRYRYVPT